MKRLPQARIAAYVSLFAALLTACASSPRRQSAPPSAAPVVVPAAPADMAGIPDAVPRFEARSTKGNPVFYEVAGKRYFVLKDAAGYRERGMASWYGPSFHTKRTSNGEAYDMYAMSAAHKTLPLPSYARVTNLATGRSVVVRINDRGPFVGNRIIDLSYTAASRLDVIRKGTAFVEVEVLLPDPDTPAAAATRAPIPAPASPPGLRTATESATPMFVQAGAFGSQGNAQQLFERLRAAGLGNAFLRKPAGAQNLFRVRIGPIHSVAEYDRTLARLAELGIEGRLATD